MMRCILIVLTVLAAWNVAWAGSGDPQTKTDHPWYPGELSCSTFERLFKAQAAQYERVTGRKVVSEHDKALASWFWRNTNYHHCTCAALDLWDKGPGKGTDITVREYWAGLFAYGYGLCYATHAQWNGEMAELLGPSRSRSMSVTGHTTFEVYLTGGAYGRGKWALLDHDVSTVFFTPDGKRLMGLKEVSDDLAALKKGKLPDARQHGWLPGGLHPSDPGAYARYGAAQYASGYASVPPMVHLRAGETLRRYHQPGLEDGKTYAYWGINYNTKGIPGPERSRTWVNQPEKMYRSKTGSRWIPGQGRYSNAVYTYKPDFATGKYREGVVEEGADHVTFEFYTPYVIAAAPPARAAKEKWGIYKSGCTGGLVIGGKAACPVSVSTDQGKTWQKAGSASDGMDLTDMVKGHQQYFIRFGAAAKNLAGAGLTMRTVCQCSPTAVPRLKDGTNKVTFYSSGRAVISAGPNSDQAAAHLVAGKFASSSVTLELAAPRKARAVHRYAAARQESGSPPRTSGYNIRYSTDGGKTWKPVVADWRIIRRKPEPGDFWSQSFVHGDVPLGKVVGPVRVHFSNTGGRRFQRAEAHLVYEVANTSPVEVTYAWKEGASGEVRTASHTYPATAGREDSSWTIRTGRNVKTVWVEYAAE